VLVLVQVLVQVLAVVGTMLELVLFGCPESGDCDRCQWWQWQRQRQWQ
jgi:hypothetical protein